MPNINIGILKIYFVLNVNVNDYHREENAMKILVMMKMQVVI